MHLRSGADGEEFGGRNHRNGRTDGVSRGGTVIGDKQCTCYCVRNGTHRPVVDASTVVQQPALVRVLAEIGEIRQLGRLHGGGAGNRIAGGLTAIETHGGNVNSIVSGRFQTCQRIGAVRIQISTSHFGVILITQCFVENLEITFLAGVPFEGYTAGCGTYSSQFGGRIACGKVIHSHVIKIPSIGRADIAANHNMVAVGRGDIREIHHIFSPFGGTDGVCIPRSHRLERVGVVHIGHHTHFHMSVGRSRTHWFHPEREAQVVDGFTETRQCYEIVTAIAV